MRVRTWERLDTPGEWYESKPYRIGIFNTVSLDGGVKGPQCCILYRWDEPLCVRDTLYQAKEAAEDYSCDDNT